MAKKIVKGILIGVAGSIALAYAFGYDYLFSGISKTYLRGKTSADIDDESLFPSHLVANGAVKPLTKAENYNKTKLSAELEKNLVDSHTASFLVLKDGKLVHEQYWGKYTASTPTNSFSMAKAVTVMLLGKALEDGKVKSVDEKFSDFYDDYAGTEFGKDVTLKNLAEMEAGFKWDENYNNPFLPNAKAYYGKSLYETVFFRGFKEQPGTKFEYQSGATQLLGFALRKATNQPLASYLSRSFWIPLGMEKPAKWSVDENGMEKTFCCIHAIPRDFAKFGLLFLNNGKVGEYQVLNSDFIQKMITPTKHSDGIYGMGIWVNNDNPIKHYYFLGLMGQYIIMIPEKNMVIVKTGSYSDNPKNDRGRPDQAKFMVNEVAKLFN